MEVYMPGWRGPDQANFMPADSRALVSTFHNLVVHSLSKRVTRLSKSSTGVERIVGAIKFPFFFEESRYRPNAALSALAIVQVCIERQLAIYGTKAAAR